MLLVARRRDNVAMPASDTVLNDDTIAARATAAGAAAIAVIRISGPDARRSAEAVAGPGIPPWHARLRDFRDAAGTRIDRGLVLFFPRPRSFTGEDVVELQCHGGPTVVDWLLEALYATGVRPAEPGEFSLRAYRNGKLDLTQAEAIADLIGSGSRDAARAALRSLDGAFAAAVADIQQQLTALRVQCEAWLDFPEEELDPETLPALANRSAAVAAALAGLEARAGSGIALTDGLRIAIAGPANAGKSSLLNRLTGVDAAIVSSTPGTTRDALERRTVIAGVPVELVDTAGLRESDDPIESQGIDRARAAMAGADLVLWLTDATLDPDAAQAAQDAAAQLPAETRLAILVNKIDLLGESQGTVTSSVEIVHAERAAAAESDATRQERARDQSAVPAAVLRVSALRGTGIDAIVDLVAGIAGRPAATGTFSARRRHVTALVLARGHAVAAKDHLDGGALDLAAEELRSAQQSLSRITGEVSSDELLGEIFSTFCIGK